MALQLNRVLLAGNLTRDPVVRTVGSDRAVADFALAINRKFKTADGQLKEEVVFVDIEAWGRTAELVGQYLTKGRACFVEGRLRLDSWDDKKDGSKRSKIKIVADTVQFLDSNRERGQGGGSAESDQDSGDAAPAAPVRPAAPPAGGDDEPPF